MKQVIPLRRRLIDLPLIIFFSINLLFITYIVDIEQIIIPDPNNFSYPIWPLPFMVDIIHSYGRNFDPLLMARPTWWQVTIWIDALLFGPFYVVALYAFIKGKNWIRQVCFIYASVMVTNVTIILGEEIFGPYRTPQLWFVLLDNAPWFLMPLYLIARMWNNPQPFTQTLSSAETQVDFSDRRDGLTDVA
ncbi:MAG: DUF2781 domain-containing protein [Chloroflexi bacterium]|uniref:DUF2781 domain-containing protein n=1 Tax=Candidatus Chlorohelix allophototropha TaxID=3003348 RepID=A0A8T7M5K3_9CHLR|nr:DUF2781 domain-containing protein [Chloroflexota bacterium]WJW69287.1 DUF2781 domain-containing protein [Chloroflexota bacterium L227-S17]